MVTKLSNFSLAQSYATLPEGLYSRSAPSSAPSPTVILFNSALDDELGLGLGENSDIDLANWLSGSQLPQEIEPISQAYAGHQFGNFTNLGDGRAHLLGDFLATDGLCYDMALKGSGPTVFARRGDGFAGLGPMLREYLISDAMHHLGIPTTRSLAVIGTGQRIVRQSAEAGAVLCRIARSHIRVGTFQWLAARRDLDGLRALADFAIRRHDPDFIEHAERYRLFYQNVMTRQIQLVVEWMRVGFVHGVMNTDNMAISGETIDYGPCAFMDEYDPATVFSSIDHAGRYAYANQPVMAQWNLARLGEALIPILGESQDQSLEWVQSQIENYAEQFQTEWLGMMRRKLGLCDDGESEDLQLIRDGLAEMAAKKIDYTNGFRDLAGILDQAPTTDWQSRWSARIARSGAHQDHVIAMMRANNPSIIPRNHQVEKALNFATLGDLDPFVELMDALRTPYEDHPNHDKFRLPPNDDERVQQTFCGT